MHFWPWNSLAFEKIYWKERFRTDIDNGTRDVRYIVLEELLGEEASVFRSLKEDSGCSRNSEESDHVDNQPLYKPNILECLAEMIVATACYALRSSPLYTIRADFYESFMTNIPEFRQLKKMLEATDNRLLDKLDDDRTVSQI